MDLEEYTRCVAGLPFGKRLPNALYVYRSEGSSLGTELEALVGRLTIAFQISDDFNVLKFRMDELKVSFLSYPDFITDPHPALRHAITIDLVTGKTRHSSRMAGLIANRY